MVNVYHVQRDDCDEYVYCADMKKFGGPVRKKMLFEKTIKLKKYSTIQL